MKKQVKKVIILSTGIFFIVLGIIGLFLPVLQGILFIAIGFLFLSFYFPSHRLKLNKYIEKYPKISKTIEKIEKWLIKIIGEI